VQIQQNCLSESRFNKRHNNKNIISLRNAKLNPSSFLMINRLKAVDNGVGSYFYFFQY